MSTQPHAFEEVEFNAPFQDAPSAYAALWAQQEAEQAAYEAEVDAEIAAWLNAEEDEGEREPEFFDEER